MIRLCQSILLDPSEVDDAAQEVFLKAYRLLHRFRGDSALSTWLYRVATNHCLDLLRKKRRHRTESWDALLDSQGDRVEALMSSPDPVESGDARELTDRMLSLLPPDYRTILVLREVQGLTYDEIAVSMECSLDSVKARLRRARQALTEKLRHYYPELSVQTSAERRRQEEVP